MAIGHRHVLDQAVDGGGGNGGGFPGGGTVQCEQAGGGGVTRGEVGHGDGKDRAIWRDEVGDHRAVAGFAHGEDFVFAAADADAFLAILEGAGAVGGLVQVRAGRRFDEQVLGVGTVGGEAPGDAAVVAHDEHGHTGGGGAGQGALGRVDAGEKPDCGQGKAEMRVAGEERGAGGRMAGVDGPGVAGAGGVGEGVGEVRQGGGEAGCGVGNRRIEGGVRGGGGGPGGRGALGAGQFGAPVGR